MQYYFNWQYNVSIALTHRHNYEFEKYIQRNNQMNIDWKMSGHWKGTNFSLKNKKRFEITFSSMVLS